MQISELQTGASKAAVNFPHFPSSWQAVLWRNWGIIPLERLAKILECKKADLLKAGEDLGLKYDDSQCELWLKRGYQTIIRQNWHLLNYSQLLTILDWSVEKLDFILREDDFLWVKLGHAKPEVKVAKFSALTEEQQAQTAAIKNWHQVFLQELPALTEEPFAFLEKSYSYLLKEQAQPSSDLRMIYSYSALYGDPLLDIESDPYPDQLLKDYAAAGINAVWMPALLYSLVPWFGESKYSENCEKRLENLRKLAKRLTKYGLKLILYINEPRAMPDEFFKLHPDWRGEKEAKQDLYALCTSNPEVLQLLSKGIEKLFNAVPELGGLFCISMSENLTHCFSRLPAGARMSCDLCRERKPAEVVAEVLQAIEKGLRKANPNAEMIAWSWAWRPEWDEEVLDKFPPDCKLMMVSESYLETDCFGVKGSIIDYSISKPGPGPAFVRLAKLAAEKNIPIIAKVQINNTWENSAVPYIPVPALVDEHLNNLRKLGVKNFMASWTLGGFPGGNLPLLDKNLKELFQEKFAEAATDVLEACSYFAEAFRFFPFHQTSQIYLGPQNYGPQNLLFGEKTGYSASMIGFPFDHLEGWTGYGHYPEDIFEKAFAELSRLWKIGLDKLQNCRKSIKPEAQAAFEDLLNVAQASYYHFHSSYLQIKFVRRRDEGNKQEMLEIIDEEIILAKKLLELCRKDSRIGFEATNHYFYNENTLKEKILNCREIRLVASC